MELFDFQPTLDGNLVALRPLEKQDFNALYQIASDPLIWEQLPRAVRYRREVFEVFFAESLSLDTTLVIVERYCSEIIGSSRYARFDANRSEVEIGWTFLARRCWGQGHNREAKKLMLQHAFKYVRSVFFVAAATNLRSRRAIEKLGAVLQKELDWPPASDDQDRSIMYRIERENCS